MKKQSGAEQLQKRQHEISHLRALDLALNLFYFTKMFLSLVAVEQIQRAEEANRRATVTRYKCAKQTSWKREILFSLLIVQLYGYQLSLVKITNMLRQMMTFYIELPRRNSVNLLSVGFFPPIRHRCNFNSQILQFTTEAEHPYITNA